MTHVVHSHGTSLSGGKSPRELGACPNFCNTKSISVLWRSEDGGSMWLWGSVTVNSAHTLDAWLSKDGKSPHSVSYVALG